MILHTETVNYIVTNLPLVFNSPNMLAFLSKLFLLFIPKYGVDM